MLGAGRSAGTRPGRLGPPGPGRHLPHQLKRCFPPRAGRSPAARGRRRSRQPASGAGNCGPLPDQLRADDDVGLARRDLLDLRHSARGRSANRSEEQDRELSRRGKPRADFFLAMRSTPGPTAAIFPATAARTGRPRAAVSSRRNWWQTRAFLEDRWGSTIPRVAVIAAHLRPAGAAERDRGVSRGGMRNKSDWFPPFAPSAPPVPADWGEIQPGTGQSLGTRCRWRAI